MIAHSGSWTPPSYNPCERVEDELTRLRARLERAEGLLRDCKESVGMVSELTVLSTPLKIDDSIRRRSDRAKQIRKELYAFLRGD